MLSVKELYSCDKSVLLKEIEIFTMYCVRECLGSSANFLKDSDYNFNLIDKRFCVSSDYDYLDLCRWIYHLRHFDN